MCKGTVGLCRNAFCLKVSAKPAAAGTNAASDALADVPTTTTQPLLLLLLLLLVCRCSSWEAGSTSKQGKWLSSVTRMSLGCT
jgi:hypothetical protein